MDLLLDETTHDLVFTNGKIPTTSNLADSVKQRLKITLLTFKGEWFLDTKFGIPYFQQIFGKARKKDTVDSIFYNQILADPDVAEVASFSSTISGRSYTLVFTVKISDGTTTSPITLITGV